MRSLKQIQLSLPLTAIVLLLGTALSARCWLKRRLAGERLDGLGRRQASAIGCGRAVAYHARLEGPDPLVGWLSHVVRTTLIVVPGLAISPGPGPG